MQDEINSYIPFFSENKNPSTFSLFEYRKFFNEQTIGFITGSYLEAVLAPNSTLRQIPFSDIYGKNSFYGIIDDEEDIVLPVNDPAFLKSIGSSNGREILIQNFVADAFRDMNEYLKQQKLKNAFPNSPFINIKPKMSFYDSNSLYLANLLLLASDFKNESIKNKKLSSSVIDFKSFVEEYTKYLKNKINLIPFTKSKTVSYFNFGVLLSGLAINFSEDDPGDDVNKYVKYLLDDAFICFSEACVRFGFKFDKNIPFLLVADIASPAMKPYLNKYGIKNVNDLFKKRFKKVYTEDFQLMKFAFYDLYNFFIRDNEEYGEDLNKICSKEANRNIKKIRQKSPAKQSIESFNDLYWMRLYVYLKSLELSNPYNQDQFENIVRIANNFVKLNKSQEAIKFVNSRFVEVAGESLYYNALLSKKSVLELNGEAFGSKPKNVIIF